MHVLAKNANIDLNESAPHIFSLMSGRGKEIYFPHQGILGQSSEAAETGLNATIGIACEDDLSPMRLGAIANSISLPPKQVFPYASSFGNASLRKLWMSMLLKKNPSLAGKKFSVPVICSGITHAIFNAGYLFLDEGEEVLIPSPYWDNYSLIFENILGAKIFEIPFFNPQGKIDIDALRYALKERAGRKITLLFNYPNNPTGYTPLDSEMEAICSTLKEATSQGTRLVVLVDDAYFGLVYEEGVFNESIFSRLVNTSENIFAVKIDGATKEDYVWGLRVGFLTFGGVATTRAYEIIADKAAGITRGVVSSGCQLSQSLILKAYETESYAAQKQDKHTILKNRFESIKRILAQHREYQDYFHPLPFNSGYFMCLKLKQLEPEAVRRCLLEDYNTGVIAIGGLIRIAYSSVPVDKIPQLFENIYFACKKLAQRTIEKN